MQCVRVFAHLRAWRIRHPARRARRVCHPSRVWWLRDWGCAWTKCREVASCWGPPSPWTHKTPTNQHPPTLYISSAPADSPICIFFFHFFEVVVLFMYNGCQLFANIHINQLISLSLSHSHTQKYLLMATVSASGELAQGQMTSDFKPLVWKTLRKASHDEMDPTREEQSHFYSKGNFTRGKISRLHLSHRQGKSTHISRSSRLTKWTAICITVWYMRAYHLYEQEKSVMCESILIVFVWAPKKTPG